jgi:DNA-binding MarR family transcriptional regulator
MTARGTVGPARFEEMMRRANRNRDVSRVAVSILRADSKVSQVLQRALAEVGLTLPQFNVLMELASSPEAALPLYELNGRLISTPPNTSWLCTRMVESGLVTKDRGVTDSRVVILKLTERGWARLGDAAPRVFEAEKQLLGSYSRDELRHLADLLGKSIVGVATTLPRQRSRKGRPVP